MSGEGGEASSSSYSPTPPEEGEAGELEEDESSDSVSVHTFTSLDTNCTVILIGRQHCGRVGSHEGLQPTHHCEA